MRFNVKFRNKPFKERKLKNVSYIVTIFKGCIA